MVAIEMLSPMAVDVEMESPKSEELLPQQKAGTFNCFILKMEMGSRSSSFFTCISRHNLVTYGTFRLNYCTFDVSHYYHSTTSGVFTSNTSLTTGYLTFPLHSQYYISLLDSNLLLFSFSSPRPRQRILLCFSSPQTQRTGYGSLSVQVT